MDNEAAFLTALHEGVSIATGCTEPVAVAFAAATCAEILGHAQPQEITVKVSSNIMKNALAVIVPGTGAPGLKVAAAVGYLYGESAKQMKVIPPLSASAREAVSNLAASGKIRLAIADVQDKLYVELKVKTVMGDSAEVYIAGGHTNIYLLKKNGETIQQKTRPAPTGLSAGETFLQQQSFQQIWDFCLQVPLQHLQFLQQAQECNLALAEEGLHHRYGMGIGAALGRQQRTVQTVKSAAEIISYTAAASDARMGGAPLPAVTNSGSGNQGITATVPVCVVAKQQSASEEQLLRALALSHLTAIYIHSFLPVLSAYCATHSAAMGAAAGITYLLSGQAQEAGNSIKNMIGDATGMVCTGAGCSCAIKVTTSVQTMLKAVELAMQGVVVPAGNGIVAKSVDETIRHLGKLTSQGLAVADKTILQIMLDN